MAKYTKRTEDYSKWYGEVIDRAGLAEHSDVRGCMVIKPHGFAIWENMKSILDQKFKETGHKNAYFPLFIPKSYLNKEAQHVEGFAKECAVVTHYRLKIDEEHNLITDPDAKLEEELIVRPTSETIIWNSYKNWIESYRDLPLKVNQWANVVRWEMRTRLFLRTTEFLWQEGHTAHATKEEAVGEAEKMLHVYADFAENYMAMPVIRGFKTESERFAGAIDTYCIEALMQDGKALQAGTSHFLGQNFAKAFDVKFANKEGNQEYVWATSWGVSTRLIGGLIMTHSDDEGLVLPPKIAPLQVAIVPIYRAEDQLEAITVKANKLKIELEQKGISVIYDDDDNRRPGWKFSQYEAQGVPVRVAIGPRDIENNKAEVARRDTKEKNVVNWDGIANYIEELLDTIQDNLFQKALAFRDSNITEVDSYEAFKKVLKEKGGFISAHWDGSPESENKIKEETKATIRCIPIDGEKEEGICIYSGKPSHQRVLFAKAY